MLQRSASNFQKGRFGETTVIKTLAKHCPTWEIRNTSGKPAESDIHLVSPNDELIAFECKYKQIITRQDTEKSCRDIQNLKRLYGSKFIGYMFISLRSINVPHRGFYETVEGIPTLWVGLDDDCAPYMLPRTIQMMVRLAQDMCNITPCERDVDYDCVMNVIKSNRKTIVAANRTLVKLQQHIKELDANNLEWIDNKIRKQ